MKPRGDRDAALPKALGTGQLGILRWLLGYEVSPPEDVALTS